MVDDKINRDRQTRTVSATTQIGNQRGCVWRGTILSHTRGFFSSIIYAPTGDGSHVRNLGPRRTGVRCHPPTNDGSASFFLSEWQLGSLASASFEPLPRNARAQRHSLAGEGGALRLLAGLARSHGMRCARVGVLASVSRKEEERGERHPPIPAEQAVHGLLATVVDRDPMDVAE